MQTKQNCFRQQRKQHYSKFCDTEMDKDEKQQIRCIRFETCEMK